MKIILRSCLRFCIFFRIELHMSGVLGVRSCWAQITWDCKQFKKGSIMFELQYILQNWIVDVWPVIFFMDLCLSSDCLMHLGIKNNSRKGWHSRLVWGKLVTGRFCDDVWASTYALKLNYRCLAASLWILGLKPLMQPEIALAIQVLKILRQSVDCEN